MAEKGRKGEIFIVETGRAAGIGKRAVKCFSSSFYLCCPPSQSGVRGKVELYMGNAKGDDFAMKKGNFFFLSTKLINKHKFSATNPFLRLRIQTLTL